MGATCTPNSESSTGNFLSQDPHSASQCQATIALNCFWASELYLHLCVPLLARCVLRHQGSPRVLVRVSCLALKWVQLSFLIVVNEIKALCMWWTIPIIYTQRKRTFKAAKVTIDFASNEVVTFRWCPVMGKMKSLLLDGCKELWYYIKLSCR